MIYLTGDTHIPIDIKKLNTSNFPQQKDMTRDDYVIVLGDFGLFWHKDKTFYHWRNWLEEKPFTLLWIDGNHENHEWINRLPVSTWHGGKVHKTSDNIIHLIRGNHYEIDGLHFFAAGGAQSYDRLMRIQGESWWKEELWSYQEQNYAFNVLQELKDKNIKIDYILSHTCPKQLIQIMFDIDPNEDFDPTTKILDEILTYIGFDNFEQWYFGHWHQDKTYSKFQCLYNKVIPIS